MACARSLTGMIAAAGLAGGLSAAAASAAFTPQSGASARIRQYVAAYQRASLTLVADESTTQTVTRTGRVVHTRRTTGELFSTFIGETGVWMSVHDVASVDGEPVADHADVRAVLRDRPWPDVARDIAAANARYNIGPVARNFNEPMLALQLLAPARADDVQLDRERATASANGPSLVTMRLRLRDRATFVGSLNGRRVRVDGTVTAHTDSGVVVGTTLNLDDGQVSATLETTYALDARLDMWVPTTFVEVYRADRTADVTTVRSTYTNYRRFESTGRVVN